MSKFISNLSISLLLIILMGISCTEQPKARHVKVQDATKIQSQITPPIVKKDDFESRNDSISLFTVNLIETTKGDSAGFVSVSDIDVLPGNDHSPADSVNRLVIPSLKNKTAGETQYLTLESKYRKRLLTGTGISETDSLYIYDYSNNASLKFPVSSLNAVASLSAYEDHSVAEHSAREYMLGFEINRAALKGLNSHYFNTSFVYIGTANPFTNKQMHPVIWKKTAPVNIPAVALAPDEVKLLKGYQLNGTFNFESDGFHYYLKQYHDQSPYSSTSLRLLITNSGNELVLNTLYYESDGESPAPLSFAGNNKNTLEQWTGRLLKNRPPVILGFEYLSFGCPILPFADKSHRYVTVNCDNRH